MSVSKQEQDLELELEKLYSRASHLCQSESRSLAYAGEQHKQVPAAIKKLQETLQQTSGVADELSGRVRKLDMVCGRVSETLKLVNDMRELHECSDHVKEAIWSKDYEQAAKYVARFRAAKDALPPGTDDASVRKMREAEQELGGIVRNNFETAMAQLDNESVSRYAKLFHPLGIAGEGVDKYVAFIRRMLADKCNAAFQLLTKSSGKHTDAGPTPHAETLTSIFVAIAELVQKYQQSVEEEFGPENFLAVVRGLLDESDVQGMRVVDRFAQDHIHIFALQNSCDMKQIGMVLEETALITQRTQQFSAYIRGVSESVVEIVPDKEAFIKSLPAGHSEIDGLPEAKLMERVQSLVSSYVEVENHFLVNSVGKAISETDTLYADDPDQFTTTVIDESFFVLQQSMFRAITTCDINAVCAVVNHVNGAISGEIRTALAANLTESKRLYGNWVANVKHLSPPVNGEHPLHTMFLDAEGRLRNPLTSASSWPHSLNNLQECVGYMDKLKESTEEAFDEYFPSEGPDKDKRVMFQQLLEAFDATKAELESLHTTSCKDVIAMIKCHLSPMLQPLSSLDYEINEAQYQDFQVNDPFAREFNSKAEMINQHLRSVLNPISCEEIMQQLAEQTCRRIESSALNKNKKFSIFGALQFESDVRALCSFFTSVSEHALRHKFARLFEMSSILNLESTEELRDLCNEMRTWRLTSEEMQKLLISRTDFDATEAEIKMLLPG